MKYTIIFLCLLVFGLFQQPLLARHIIGGEITYECLGEGSISNTNLYQFQMDIYRDCQGSGAPFDSAPGAPFDATVTIYANTDSLVAIYEITDVDIEFVDPNANDCMQIPANVCVERGTYIFPTIELKHINSSYHIVYQRCCRNETISNLVNPGGTGATYSIEITPAAQRATPCNSSPTFNSIAPVVICVDDFFEFDHSATDKDGHRLEYSFCRPFDGGGPNTGNPTAPEGVAPSPDTAPPHTGVVFMEPNFTTDRPLGLNASIEIDSLTGQLSGYPRVQGQFVLAVCVKEYNEQNELLSEVRRDFQFNVVPCIPFVDAKVASDSVVGGRTNTHFIRSCGQFDVTFLNESTDRNRISSILWEFYLPDDTIRTNTWDASIEFPSEGLYEGILIANPNLNCGDTTRLNIMVTPRLESNFSFEYDTCTISPVKFRDASIIEAEAVTRTWLFGDGDTTNMLNPNHQYELPGTFEARLKLEDSNGCISIDSKDVPYYPRTQLIDIALDNDELCIPDSIQFSNLSDPINDEYTVVWNFGDGSIDTAINITHLYEKAGEYDVSLEISSPTGCKNSRNYPALVLAKDSPLAAFSYTPDMPSSIEPEVQFMNESIDNVFNDWVFGTEAESNLVNPIHIFRDTGLYRIQLVVQNNVGCMDTLIQFIDVFPDTRYFLPNAFTPNADGKNDVFIGKGSLSNLSDFSMTIWSRYGQLVFNTDNPAIGWNGQLNNAGTALSQGVYVYAIQYKTARGEREERSGTVAVVR